MKVSEFKIKTVNGINNLIDDYFGSKSISEKLINSTLKIIVKQNQHKFDNLLELFSDEKGEIDTNILIEEYSNILGSDGIILDLRNWIKSDFIKSILPDKALRITKEDIINTFR